MPATYRLVSPPPTGQAAIAVLQLTGDIDDVLTRLGVRAVETGRVGLREVPGVDTLVIARFAPAAALLFPHAGAVVVRRLFGALDRAGLTLDAYPSISVRFPEASSLIEARMLDALARAASPLAIDLLLDQPRRWADAANDPARVLPDFANTALKRLIEPPVVVAYGPPNIGKSSLLNALAGRSVSIVADEPGTTRDHVGVMLDLGGLVVRFIDAPGMDSPSQREGDHSILSEAQRLARDAAAAADLILLCADAQSRFLAPPATTAQSIRLALRADRGLAPEPHDLGISARSGSGIEALVARIRDELVPPGLLSDPRAWRFW